MKAAVVFGSVFLTKSEAEAFSATLASPHVLLELYAEKVTDLGSDSHPVSYLVAGEELVLEILRSIQ